MFSLEVVVLCSNVVDKVSGNPCVVVIFCRKGRRMCSEMDVRNKV